MALETIEDLRRDFRYDSQKALVIFELLGRGLPPRDLSARSGYNPSLTTNLPGSYGFGNCKEREPMRLFFGSQIHGPFNRDIASLPDRLEAGCGSKALPGISERVREVDGVCERPRRERLLYGTAEV
jgi:hypothetical protein